MLIVIHLKKLFLYFFLLAGFVAFSRAGSGGGSHGSSGGHHSSGGSYHYHHSSYNGSGSSDPFDIPFYRIIVGALVIYSLTVSYLYYFKPMINKRKMKASFERDAFWDHGNIIGYTKRFYIELQQAWSDGDLLPIRQKLSPRLYRSLMGMLQKQKAGGIRNTVEDVEIDSAGVIYFDDFHDNSKDKVAILVRGNMKDYFSGPGITPSAAKKPFKDACVFIRQNNQLILDEIINEPTLYHVATRDNHIENHLS